MDNAQITTLCFGEIQDYYGTKYSNERSKKIFSFNNDKKLLSTISYNFIFCTFTEI